MNGEITDLNDEKKLLETDIEKLMYKRECVVKGIFGKRVMRANDCQDQIEELDHRQKTEKLTATEERAILKDLKDLQNSLPLIIAVDAIDTEIKGFKDTKRVFGKKIRVKIDERNVINTNINEVKAKQKDKKDEMDAKDAENKEGRTKHPITIKIEETKAKIDTCRAEKQVLKDAHDKHYKDWRDQNELEAKIKWIKQQKAHLLRVKQDADWHAERKAEEDAVKAEKEEYERVYGKPKKYQPQIDVCENLVTFLHSLQPRSISEDEEG